MCLALLLAQGLGQAHALSHASGPWQGQQEQQEQQGHSGDWIGGSHDAGDADCRLIDQLSHADGLSSWPLAVPALMPAGDGLVLPAPAPLPRRALAPSRARAPPRL